MRKPNLFSSNLVQSIAVPKYKMDCQAMFPPTKKNSMLFFLQGRKGILSHLQSAQSGSKVGFCLFCKTAPHFSASASKQSEEEHRLSSSCHQCYIQRTVPQLFTSCVYVYKHTRVKPKIILYELESFLNVLLSSASLF